MTTCSFKISIEEIAITMTEKVQKYRVTNRDMGGYVTWRDKKSKVSRLQTHLLFYLLGRLNFPIS